MTIARSEFSTILTIALGIAAGTTAKLLVVCETPTRHLQLPRLPQRRGQLLDS